MEAFERFEVDGLTVELWPDESPSSPAEWDTLGTLTAFSWLSRQYDFAQEDADGMVEDAAERGGARLVVRYLWATRGLVAVPFNFADYGSSGARIRPFALDSDGQPDGFTVTSAERVRELCGDPAEGELFYAPADWQGTPREWVEEQLRGELREWDQWVQGAVVGIVVKDPDGKVLESVWGCYPDNEGDGLGWIREEGREMAEAEAEMLREKTRQVARAWASLYLSRGFAAVAS